MLVNAHRQKAAPRDVKSKRHCVSVGRKPSASILCYRKLEAGKRYPALKLELCNFGAVRASRIALQYIHRRIEVSSTIIVQLRHEPSVGSCSRHGRQELRHDLFLTWFYFLPTFVTCRQVNAEKYKIKSSMMVMRVYLLQIMSLSHYTSENRT